MTIRSEEKMFGMMDSASSPARGNAVATQDVSSYQAQDPMSAAIGNGGRKPKANQSQEQGNTDMGEFLQV